MSKADPTRPALVWLRDDLRLDDNPALEAAAKLGRPLLLAYVYDDESCGVRPLGGAARWWLHHSLESLAAGVRSAGARLDLFKARCGDIVPALAAASNAAAVFWNRRYGPAERAVDDQIEAVLTRQGVEVAALSGHLMHEPASVAPKSAGFFKVFTPFWRAEQALGAVSKPVPAPRRITASPYPADGPSRASLDAMALLPKQPDWAAGLRDAWRPGEGGAVEALKAFVGGQLSGYATGRDRPAVLGTSRLSPHLRFGEVSARRVYWAAADAVKSGRVSQPDGHKFHTELAWRDFNYNILVGFPELPKKSFQSRFESFPWQPPNRSIVRAWQKGSTGYPIVDAGMRQLWQTGYMHNRVRLIAGSFLVKHLLLDWRIGEEWFWDCLCDADLANNTANWQWVAGSGADAAPYFRIFNPTLQGQKFDPDGEYVRRYVPELARLPTRWIHEPWAAPGKELTAAGITLGTTYPAPIVDHKAARQRALGAFQTITA